MRSYAHLSEDERDQIGVLRAAGRSMGAIARALGRAKATISRERWIPTRGATPSIALVPQEKAGFPITNPRLLLGFQGTKTARREGISSPFSDAGGWNSGHSFIGQWSPSSISARRSAPQEIGERPFPLNDAEAGNIAAKGKLLHVRTERGCRFIRL
jgi:Helix-turn-helix domain